MRVSEKMKCEVKGSFIKEYKMFLEKYLFRLMGLVNKTVTEPEHKVRLEKDQAPVVQEGNTLYFSMDRWLLFKLELEDSKGLTKDNLRLSNRIIEVFKGLSENKRSGSGKQNKYVSDSHRELGYNLAIQRGLCAWIIGSTEIKRIDRFLHVLEKWTVKTYEGKNVTLGFVINPDAESTFDNTYGDWITFLEEDTAAVLTDCIHSVIELNAECNYVGHLSISEGDRLAECELNNYTPLRFTQVIDKYLTDNKRVGVFLLNNGDIILAKKGATCFVKRNMQWLNLSYPAFENSLKPFKDKYAFHNEALIKSVFASVLDVSFSHAGGIIAIVGSDKNSEIVKSLTQDNVLNACDNLLSGESCQDIYDRESRDIYASGEDTKTKLEDLKKRLLKRNVIQSLTGGRTFTGLDRKLRSELMSLDGACILSGEGSVLSFGAIIQNDSGSTGGGRGAAAKKLSTYGMAVKISTDGYIELYIDRSLKYAIK